MTSPPVVFLVADLVVFLVGDLQGDHLPEFIGK
jgi:hypothetical protein